MAETIRYSFARYEQKYFLTPDQQQVLLDGMREHMTADGYGQYTVCNIYYDTEDWRLVRRSIEKPAYKEKLRVRSYGVPAEDGRVFAELKKKCGGVVYKRRVTVGATEAEPFLSGLTPEEPAGQIAQEIRWFQQRYRARPRVFIAYDRTAYAGREDPTLRVTFDTGLRWRDRALDLCLEDDGEPVLAPGSPYAGRILMELKTAGACPLWLVRILSAVRAYPVSFSKYGSCYTEHILKRTIQREALRHA